MELLRRVKNVGHLMEAVGANLLYGFPSKKLRVIAITGTDGKTTSTTLTYEVLKKAGKKVALISTVAAYIGEEEIDTGFHVTNPSPFALQKLLSRCAREGMEFVVLEMTSHGIDQYRNWGIHPEIAGITNVTHEHLDYHKTYDNYLRTKATLLTGAGFALINADAKDSVSPLETIVKESGVPFMMYSVGKLPSVIKKACEKRFGSQQYNFENVALVEAIASKLEIEVSVVKGAIEKFPGVKGRMETIQNKSGIHVIVDFAHTPNALDVALHAARATMKSKGSKGKLIVVFGCAGLRDIGKRPLMGDIATRLADMAVFTAEDPRTEDIWSILNQMKSGVKVHHDRVVSVPDRFEAIQFALTKLAKKGDTVIMCGKGHEQSMCYGTVETPWSDQEAVRKILSV